MKKPPQVHIRIDCSYCNGAGQVELGMAKDHKGQPYMRYQGCPMCEGTGYMGKWISVKELLALQEQTRCPHNHITTEGCLRVVAGEAYDDIQEFCADCGAQID